MSLYNRNQPIREFGLNRGLSWNFSPTYQSSEAVLDSLARDTYFPSQRQAPVDTDVVMTENDRGGDGYDYSGINPNQPESRGFLADLADAYPGMEWMVYTFVGVVLLLVIGMIYLIAR